MADAPHADVLKTATKHLRDVFESSPDGVYVWVDEEHKDCNERCARLFGRTVDEWRSVKDFLGELVAEEDRAMYGRNYQERVRRLLRPLTFRFRGLRKDGSTFTGETDMIPLSFHGHAVAYHFVREVED